MKGLTEKQKKLPPALQKAILAKQAKSKGVKGDKSPSKTNEKKNKMYK